MKRFPLLLLLLWSVPAALASFVYETDTEFISSGDFNGDGLLDVLVLDKATGNARVGCQNNLGAINWSATLATGVAQVTGGTAGRFLNGARDALAITASVLNRVYLFDLSNSNSAAPPVVVTPGGLGSARPDWSGCAFRRRAAAVCFAGGGQFSQSCAGRAARVVDAECWRRHHEPLTNDCK